MSANINSFFHAPTVENNFFSRAGNYAFRPYKYLFTSRQYSVIHLNNKRSIIEHSRKDTKTFLKTTLMIALLIPGLILGIVANSFSYLSRDVKDSHHALRNFLSSEWSYCSKEKRNRGSKTK